MYSKLDDEKASDESSADKGKTEMSELSPAATSSSYGSTQVQDQSNSQCYVPCCAMVFYVMSFFGFFCALLLRQGLSVAIVAMVNQTDVDNDTTGQCPREPEPENLTTDWGEFDWSRTEQGIVLAAFYVGYEFTQLPGGYMADRFGGKWLFGGCVLLSSVISLLTPVAARTDVALLITLRVISGLGEGVMFPAISEMIPRWSLPKYHTMVAIVIFLGMEGGIVVGMFVSGILCDYGFAGGWPSVFYVFGAVGCIWSVAWFLVCYNSPSTHPLISAVELKYWETAHVTDLNTQPPTPWREILTSFPVWALALAYFANNWGYYTMITCLPTYMYDVLGLNMTTNGALSAVPFLVLLIVNPVLALFADWLRYPGRLSTTVVRKIFCVSGLIFGGCFFILVGFTDCSVALAVATECAVLTCVGLVFCCVEVNHLDLAPVYAGPIMGVVYTVANLASIAAPMSVSAFTKEEQTRSEWRNVFYVTAGIGAVGALVYLVIGSGEHQSWAGDTSTQNREQADR